MDSAESDDFLNDLLSEFKAPKPERKMPLQREKPAPLPRLQRAPPVRSSEPVQTARIPSPVYIKPEPEMPVADFGDDDMMLDDIKVEDIEQIESKPTFSMEATTELKPGLQSWKDADMNMVDTFVQDTIKEESQTMNIFEQDGHVRMWWYDAYERKEKGYVYLFGKVFNKDTKRYISCCVTVKNIERNLFVLPRPFLLDGISNRKTKKLVSYMCI